MVLFALLAAFSMDLMMSGFHNLGNGFLTIITGLVGLLLGGYGILKGVYRYDKNRGRVKKEIRFFE
ncbi:hypothetical protein EDD73_10358 [Heliophilum fasciatum]|uniref:Uncharacterized protein n=2 Tax=Heliophilum fasciatum TaxID=35700 RepID=A0A4R2RZ98_9FIRM|nr:hypothetical protein EDD73_10358 [Heliophilum fasciatum]